MDQKAMIDDLVRMLDAGAAKGIGHINVAVDEALPDSKEIQTGCPDCLAAPLACSVPTLHEGLDRKEEETL